MGRTYSFEPFLSQQPAQVFKGSGPRLGNDEDKVQLTKDMEQDVPGKGALHYGQAHSETVRRYHDRQGTQKRAPAAKKTAKKALKKASAKKASTASAKPAASREKISARATSKTAERPPKEEGRPKPAPARGRLAQAVSALSAGRKVLGRATAAAKKGVAKTVKAVTARKPGRGR